MARNDILFFYNLKDITKEVDGLIARNMCLFDRSHDEVVGVVARC